MWLDDKRHGEGMFYCALDGSTYEGQWNDGRKEGRGLLRLPQGHSVEGVWKAGQLQQVTVSWSSNSMRFIESTPPKKKLLLLSSHFYVWIRLNYQNFQFCPDSPWANPDL